MSADFTSVISFTLLFVFYSSAESCNKRKSDYHTCNSVAERKDDIKKTGEGLPRAVSVIKNAVFHFVTSFTFLFVLDNFAESCNKRKGDLPRRNSVAGGRDDIRKTGEALAEPSRS